MKTSKLIGPALDWAVAKIESLALREARRGTDAEAALRSVPFTMFESVETHHPDGRLSYLVKKISVTRFGISPGCAAPSIDFKDSTGRTARSSVDRFYFDVAEAQLDCDGRERGWLNGFNPSTDWAKAGPIIEREGIQLLVNEARTEWLASCWGYLQQQYGLTPLIAAMRCFVASKLGDEVDVPTELL